MARQIIGIDFGTTKSAIALMDIGSDGHPKLVEFLSGRHIVPSLLLVDQNSGDVIHWGWEARTALRNNPHADVKRDFKRDLGKKPEAEKYSRLYLRKLVEVILRKRNIDSLSKDDYTTAIGAPANWTQKQKDLLRQIAEEAGFPDVQVHLEPVAAMHNLRGRGQGSRKFKFGSKPEKFMVIDFGGGTLDICLVQTDLLGRNPRTIATDGNSQLGGVDFDSLLEKKFLKDAALTRSKLSAFDSAELRWQIQEAKENFSRAFVAKNSSAHGNIELSDGDHPFDMSEVVFNNLCNNQGIFGKIQVALDGVLKKASIEPTEVNRVILTGGSSQWYFVMQMAAKTMALGGGEELFFTETPSEDVACGLAIMVGRDNEPPERPGVWIRFKVDGGAWSEHKIALSPGRAGTTLEPQRLLLGAISSSKLFRSRAVELEWSVESVGDGVQKTETALVKVYSRANHPKIERIVNMIDAAAGKPTQAREDSYQLFLVFREDQYRTSYSLEVQDNRKRCWVINVAPGEIVRNTWFGFGQRIRYELADSNSSGKSQKIMNNERRPLLKAVASVKAFAGKLRRE